MRVSRWSCCSNRFHWLDRIEAGSSYIQSKCLKKNKYFNIKKIYFQIPCLGRVKYFCAYRYWPIKFFIRRGIKRISENIKLLIELLD